MLARCRKLPFFVCHFGAVLAFFYAVCGVAESANMAFDQTQAAAEPSPSPAAPSSPTSSGLADQQPAPPLPALPVYRIVLGQERMHVVQPGDTPAGIAHKYQIGTATLLRVNRIPDPRRLQIGQRLLVSNRHIVPAPFDTGLAIDLLRLRLHWLREGQLVASYPIAAGRPAWETPPGLYHITGRRRDPTWYVPVSIQREMQAAGQPVRKRVPPGPENPLGKFWIQLSAPGIGLHGTNAPWSVGRYATHGCIRLHEEHVARLFAEVPDGTPVAIVGEPVRLARTSNGRVYLEVFDRPNVWSAERLAEVLRRLGWYRSVHWERAKQALADRWGVAVDITAEPQWESTRKDSAPGSGFAADQ